MTTITKAAMSLPPKYWLIGTASVIFFLACLNDHLGNTNATVRQPSATKTTTITTEVSNGEESLLDESHDIWSKGYMRQIYNWLDCPDIHRSDSALEVHNATVWKLLKDTYRNVVHKDLSSLPPPSQTSDSLKGFQVPIEIRRKPVVVTVAEEITSSSPKETLGVFTTAAIPKGTLIWKSTNTAQFTSGNDFRSYLKALPASLACDVLDWAFPRYSQVNEPLVCVDLDLGSLTNTCGEVKSDCNMVIKEELLHDSGCELEFYATRDIAAGEELQIDHDFHEAITAYIPLGLRFPPTAQSSMHENHGGGGDDDDDEDEDDDDGEEL